MSKNNDITLNISNSTLEIVSLILKNDFLHVRELARLTNISPTTASTILSSLEENSILAKKVIGNNYLYSLNRNQKSKSIAVMSEEYRALKALCSDKKLAETADGISKGMNSIKGMIDSVVISKNTILFVTSLDSNTIKDRISKEVSADGRRIIAISRETLKNNLETDEIKSMIEGHLVLHGAERFIEIMFNFN
jgi:predicted transcriptional regulator